jgi:hypothetical protein
MGFLLDSSDESSAFTARIIEDIKASNFARIELLVVKQANAERLGPGSRPDLRSLRILRRISIQHRSLGTGIFIPAMQFPPTSAETAVPSESFAVTA